MAREAHLGGDAAAAAKDKNAEADALAAADGGGGGHKLSLVPLIFLIFFEVAGGPYGAEPAVQSAGPLYALLGFLVFPFIWAVPEALVTAELSTAMPGNGGFVLWADRAFGLPHGHLEVRLGRHQRRRLPGALCRLPRPRRARRQGRRAQGRRHRRLQRCALLPQLHGAHRRGLGRRRARGRLPLAVPAHVRRRAAQDPPQALGRRRGGEGLEALLQHALLEPQLLGQRQHHGRRGGAAREDAAQGARRSRFHDVARVPAAAHGRHGRRRRRAGGLGERILRRRRRHDRRQVAQVLDRGGRGAVLHRPLLGDAEQRGVPAAGHGGPGPPTPRLRRARPRLQHALGQHRGHQRHHPGHVLLQLQQHRGGRQLPLQPGHAPRVRRLHLAPRQAARPAAAVPRAGAPAGRRGAVPRALGVPRLRHGHRRVEGVRHQRGVHGSRGRGVLPHAALQGPGLPQVQRRQRRRGGGGGGVPAPGQQERRRLTTSSIGRRIGGVEIVFTRTYTFFFLFWCLQPGVLRPVMFVLGTSFLGKMHRNL